MMDVVWLSKPQHVNKQWEISLAGSIKFIDRSSEFKGYNLVLREILDEDNIDTSFDDSSITNPEDTQLVISVNHNPGTKHGLVSVTANGFLLGEIPTTDTGLAAFDYKVCYKNQKLEIYNYALLVLTIEVDLAELFTHKALIGVSKFHIDGTYNIFLKKLSYKDKVEPYYKRWGAYPIELGMDINNHANSATGFNVRLTTLPTEHPLEIAELDDVRMVKTLSPENLEGSFDRITNTVNLTWDETPDSDAYVVVKSGEALGFAYTNSFTETEPPEGEFNYEVVSMVKGFFSKKSNAIPVLAFDPLVFMHLFNNMFNPLDDDSRETSPNDWLENPETLAKIVFLHYFANNLEDEEAASDWIETAVNAVGAIFEHAFTHNLTDMLNNLNWENVNTSGLQYLPIFAHLFAQNLMDFQNEIHWEESQITYDITKIMFNHIFGEDIEDSKGFNPWEEDNTSHTDSKIILASNEDGQVYDASVYNALITLTGAEPLTITQENINGLVTPGIVLNGSDQSIMFGHNYDFNTDNFSLKLRFNWNEIKEDQINVLATRGELYVLGGNVWRFVYYGNNYGGLYSGKFGVQISHKHGGEGLYLYTPSQEMVNSSSTFIHLSYEQRDNGKPSSNLKIWVNGVFCAYDSNQASISLEDIVLRDVSNSRIFLGIYYDGLGGNSGYNYFPSITFTKFEYLTRAIDKYEVLEDITGLSYKYINEDTLELKWKAHENVTTYGLSLAFDSNMTDLLFDENITLSVNQNGLRITTDYRIEPKEVMYAQLICYIEHENNTEVLTYPILEARKSAVYYFISNETGVNQIWKMDVDGDNKTQLTNRPYYNQPSSLTMSKNFMAFDTKYWNPAQRSVKYATKSGQVLGYLPPFALNGETSTDVFYGPVVNETGVLPFIDEEDTLYMAYANTDSLTSGVFTWDLNNIPSDPLAPLNPISSAGFQGLSSDSLEISPNKRFIVSGKDADGVSSIHDRISLKDITSNAPGTAGTSWVFHGMHVKWLSDSLHFLAGSKYGNVVKYNAENFLAYLHAEDYDDDFAPPTEGTILPNEGSHEVFLGQVIRDDEFLLASNRYGNNRIKRYNLDGELLSSILVSSKPSVTISHVNLSR